MSVFFGRGVCFQLGWFTRLGCAALGKVGIRGSGGKLGQAGRNLCAGSGEIPKTFEKAVEGIALRGGFGL